MRFLLFELLTGEEAYYWKVESTFPLAGRHWHAPHLLPGRGRLIKTHEPFRQEYHKAVYLLRDVRDVAVSEYHFQIREGVFQGSVDQFLPRFLLGKVNAYGNWMRHVESWEEAAARRRCKVLFVQYETLQRKTEETLGRVCDFLSIPATPAEVQTAIRHNSFTSMQRKGKDASILPRKALLRNAPLIRKGIVGGWHEALNTEQIHAIEHAAERALSRWGYVLSNPPEEQAD
jgi:hypothetical protein